MNKNESSERDSGVVLAESRAIAAMKPMVRCEVCGHYIMVSKMARHRRKHAPQQETTPQPAERELVHTAPSANSKLAVLNFDGACEPNPGHATCGYVIKDDTGAVMAQQAVDLGDGTNNTAEYGGLIHGLTAALSLGVTDLLVRGDSQIVVFRMTGKYNGKPKANMVPLIAQARKLTARFNSCRFEWVRREQNEEADALSTDTERAVEAAARSSGLSFT